MRAGSVATATKQHAGQVQRQADVAVAKAVVARGVERPEQRVGRRLAQPVELAEDDQRVVGVAGQGAELPQGVDEAPRRRVGRRSGDAENTCRLLDAGQRDAGEPAAEGRGQRPGEAGSADAGWTAETQDGGRVGLGDGRASLRGRVTGHQVVERLVLLPGAADVFPVKRLPQPCRRVEPFLRPPPRQLLHQLDPRLRGDGRGVRRMQAHDAVAFP